MCRLTGIQPIPSVPLVRCSGNLQLWRLNVVEWNLFNDGSMLGDFFDPFLPWGFADGKKDICLMLTDVIVVDDNCNEVIIMGEGGAVNVAVVAVVIKAVVNDALVNKTEIFEVDGGRDLDWFLIFIVLPASVEGSE
ncbi:hypothetical protein NDU88_011074 [Pleurodeles waltl]|uniref:Uncharacterized protein n=1 Tax=Pleurodeles waltl TaxID=8319 RepID=A0AAV7QW64_PLEWA|nr:hypothetical protein NDU88_011074 [Pleurodeles waltl]